MQLLAQTANSPLYRMLAKRFAEIISVMRKAGIKVHPVRYSANLKPGVKGMFEFGRIDNSKPLTASNLEIRITLAEGANYGTLFHEFVHAALVPLRAVGRLEGMRGLDSRLANAIEHYERVANRLVSTFKDIKQNLADKSQINRLRKKYGDAAIDYVISDLEESETGNALVDSNAFDNNDEAFAWALASPREIGRAHV